MITHNLAYSMTAYRKKTKNKYIIQNAECNASFKIKYLYIWNSAVERLQTLTNKQTKE